MASLAHHQLTCACSAENRARLAETQMCPQQVRNVVDQSQGFAVYRLVLALFADLL